MRFSILAKAPLRCPYEVLQCIWISEGVGYVKTQLSCVLLYYADENLFRPLWAIFRSEKCI